MVAADQALLARRELILGDAVFPPPLQLATCRGDSLLQQRRRKARGDIPFAVDDAVFGNRGRNVVRQALPVAHYAHQSTGETAAENCRADAQGQCLGILVAQPRRLTDEHRNARLVGESHR